MLFTYKSLNDLSPDYLSSPILYYQPSRNLRSLDLKKLVVPRTKKSTMGDRAFSVFAPKAWNDLDLSVKNAKSFTVFKNFLKTYLFNKYDTVFWLIIILAVYNIAYITYINFFWAPRGTLFIGVRDINATYYYYYNSVFNVMRLSLKARWS